MKGMAGNECAMFVGHNRDDDESFDTINGNEPTPRTSNLEFELMQLVAQWINQPCYLQASMPVWAMAC